MIKEIFNELENKTKKFIAYGNKRVLQISVDDFEEIKRKYSDPDYTGYSG